MQERLQKVLARAGIASRRKAEELILAGRVEVDGRKVRELGVKVDPAREMIRVDGALVADIADRVYYVLFKPSGCVTTMSDPEGRPSIEDYAHKLPERVFPVGRLDYDAEGAVILTNDGELAHRLMHPRFGAQRTYLAKVKGFVPPAVIEKLREGVRLEDGMAKPVTAELVSRAIRNTWIRLVLTEGRPHLVKRLCEAVGHPVQRLYRSDYAGVSVDGMMAGELRELTSIELRALQSGQGKDRGSGLPPRRDARRGGIRGARTSPAPKADTAEPATTIPAPERTERPARPLPSPARPSLQRRPSPQSGTRPTRPSRPSSTRAGVGGSRPSPRSATAGAMAGTKTAGGRTASKVSGFGKRPGSPSGTTPAKRAAPGAARKAGRPVAPTRPPSPRGKGRAPSGRGGRRG